MDFFFGGGFGGGLEVDLEADLEVDLEVDSSEASFSGPGPSILEMRTRRRRAGVMRTQQRCVSYLNLNVTFGIFYEVTLHLRNPDLQFWDNNTATRGETRRQ